MPASSRAFCLSTKLALALSASMPSWPRRWRWRIRSASLLASPLRIRPSHRHNFPDLLTSICPGKRLVWAASASASSTTDTPCKARSNVGEPEIICVRGVPTGGAVSVSICGKSWRQYPCSPLSKGRAKSAPSTTDRASSMPSVTVRLSAAGVPLCWAFSSNR